MAYQEYYYNNKDFRNSAIEPIGTFCVICRQTFCVCKSRQPIISTRIGCSRSKPIQQTFLEWIKKMKPTQMKPTKEEVIKALKDSEPSLFDATYEDLADAVMKLYESELKKLTNIENAIERYNTGKDDEIETIDSVNFILNPND